MFVTEDFRSDIQREVQSLPSRGLVNEYNVIAQILNTEGVGDSINTDLYLEAMDIIQAEMCKRFCEMTLG